MSDEKRGKGDALESLDIGAQYEEVGPDLGRLYEARHAVTGRPALLLLPAERVDWRPEGPWEVRLSYRPYSPSVSLVVEQSPQPVQMSELANLLVLMTASVERMERSARVRAHFMTPPEQALDSRWTSRRRAVVGLAVLMLFLGWWSDFPEGTAPPHLRPSSAELDGGILRVGPPEDETWSTEVEASSIQGGQPRPVRDQKRAPCIAGLEVEVSGVCWLSIVQRPCPRPSVAHEGQCLLPVSAPRPEPTSVDGGHPDPR